MAELLNQSVALFFIWLFTLAAWHKIRHTTYYRQLLQNWWSQGAARWLLWLVAMLEAGVALALFLPPSRNLALLVSGALLLFYATLMAWQLLLGHTDLKCGCAGPATDTTISVPLVWRNTGCALLTLVALNPLPGAGLFTFMGPVPSLNFSNAGLSVLLAIFMCLLYLCCEQLLSNAQRLALKKR